MRDAFMKIFSSVYARRTVLNSIYLLVSIVGLWAGSVYVPTSVREIAARQGYTVADGTRFASYGTMVLSAGTILGCIVLPPPSRGFRPRPPARAVLPPLFPPAPRRLAVA